MPGMKRRRKGDAAQQAEACDVWLDTAELKQNAAQVGLGVCGGPLQPGGMCPDPRPEGACVSRGGGGGRCCGTGSSGWLAERGCESGAVGNYFKRRKGGLAKLGRCRMAGTACSLRPEPLLLGVTLLEQGVGQGELRGPLPTSAVL